MRRFASPLVLAAGALAATACFPDFGFGPGSEGGGDVSSSRAASGTGAQVSAGGDGGAPTTGGGGSPGQGGIPSQGGGGGSAPMGGSSSTGVVEMPTVPCGDGNAVLVECTAGQDCCFSTQSVSLDHCGASGSCNDYVFSCNEPSDCATGVCCADEDFFGFTGTISCVSSCSGATLCAQASDCDSGQTCGQYFSNSYAPEYAPGYKVCKP